MTFFTSINFSDEYHREDKGRYKSASEEEKQEFRGKKAIGKRQG